MSFKATLMIVKRFDQIGCNVTLPTEAVIYEF